MSAIRLLPVAGTFATGTLTLAGNAANTETVVINGKTYTFQTVLTNADGNVLIGATASDSIDNLIAAINLGTGAGTLYAAATTANTAVSAAAGAGDTMDVTALAAYEGAAGNQITTTETMGSGSWGGAKLAGGGATASAAPTLTSATAGVAVPHCADQGLFLLRNVDNATGTTKTVVGGVLWGFSPVTSRWYKIGAVNTGTDLSETTSEAINYAELVVGLRKFTRLYFQFTSLGGAGTEVEVYMDLTRASGVSEG